MLIIDILENVYLLTNLQLLLMFQFFVGVGIGIFLGTEYNFRPYVNVFKSALSNIEKRQDTYDADSDSSESNSESSGSSWFFGSSKKNK